MVLELGVGIAPRPCPPGVPRYGNEEFKTMSCLTKRIPIFLARNLEFLARISIPNLVGSQELLKDTEPVVLIIEQSGYT